MVIFHNPINMLLDSQQVTYMYYVKQLHSYAIKGFSVSIKTFFLNENFFLQFNELAFHIFLVIGLLTVSCFVEVHRHSPCNKCNTHSTCNTHIIYSKCFSYTRIIHFAYSGCNTQVTYSPCTPCNTGVMHSPCFPCKTTVIRSTCSTCNTQIIHPTCSPCSSCNAHVIHYPCFRW